jgi:hypothetical protein
MDQQGTDDQREEELRGGRRFDPWQQVVARRAEQAAAPEPPRLAPKVLL